MGGHAVQNATRGGQNADAKTILNAGNLMSAHIDTATRLADTLEARNGRTPLHILQRNGDVTVIDGNIFPEMEADRVENPKGMNITIVTSATTDKESTLMLEQLGMPFRK